MLLKPSYMFSKSAPAPFDLNWFGSINPCPSFSPVRQEVALGRVACVLNLLHGACTNLILTEIIQISLSLRGFATIRIIQNVVGI